MSDVRSLLPPNATGIERNLEQASARLADIPTPLRTVWDPATCAANLLPWLAWAWAVEQWDASWTESQKRLALADALFVLAHKGTLAAVQRALSTLGYAFDVSEWWQAAGAPFTFTVALAIPGGVPPELYSQVERLINAAKNLRSHLTELRLVVPVDGVVYAAAAVIAVETTVIDGL